MPSQHDKVQLSPRQAQALVVAARALTTRGDCNSEQKSLSNYDVWIYSTDGGIAVSFIAITRPGDEGVMGGNFAYARSVKYVIDERTFQILKTIGSK